MAADGDPLGAIVAILDRSGTPCGTGFLAAAGRIVTCAHVVVASGAGPGERVRLRFPHLPGAPLSWAGVERRGWRPPDEQDVAVLDIAEVPAGASVLPLGSAAGCRNHRVSAFGFPAAAPGGRFGYAHAGDLLPDHDHRGRLLQLADANDLTVGFSGAPVVDETSGLAIGMITSINPADDQFEELLIEPVTAGRHRDLGQLTTAIRELPALGVVLIMRDDFYSRLAALAPDLLRALTPGLVNMPATLSDDDLRAIVARPAEAVGLRFEAGLVEQIVADLIAGSRAAAVTVLPLVELALLHLWQRRTDGRLTHDGYRRAGGVTGSLAGLCDQAVAALPAGQEPVARRMLTALVRAVALPGAAEAREQICAAVGHDLNAADYARYLGDQPAESAC